MELGSGPIRDTTLESCYEYLDYLEYLENLDIDGVEPVESPPLGSPAPAEDAIRRAKLTSRSNNSQISCNRHNAIESLGFLSLFRYGNVVPYKSAANRKLELEKRTLGARFFPPSH